MLLAGFHDASGHVAVTPTPRQPESLLSGASVSSRFGRASLFSCVRLRGSSLPLSVSTVRTGEGLQRTLPASLLSRQETRLRVVLPGAKRVAERPGVLCEGWRSSAFSRLGCNQRSRKRP